MRTIIRNSYTPKTGDYCKKIVVDEDTGTQYIFDCDGIYTTYTSKQQEGAPMFYVDSKVASATNEAKSYADTQDQIILQQAKDYTDEHGGGGGGGDVTKAYVDAQDTSVLNDAKSYADGKGTSTLNSAKSYADEKDTIVLNSAKAYADEKDASTLNSAKAYADTQDTSTLNRAKAYADEKDAVVAANANGYTDTAVADAVADLQDNISAITQGLATVATSGSYNDLSNKPAIPTFTLTTTDPGEGATLAANAFIGVYNG